MIACGISIYDGTSSRRSRRMCVSAEWPASFLMLTDVAQILQLSKLEILDISKNRIASIPEGIKRMTSLKFLAIARNKITRLPLALGDMPSLSKLKFDDNPIVFPPIDEILKPMTGILPLSAELGEEKDVCQKVKKFLKQQSLRQRMLGAAANGEEEAKSVNLAKCVV